MSKPLSLTGLMMTKNVIVVDRRRGEDRAQLAQRLAAELEGVDPDQPVTIVTGDREELPELPGDEEHAARLFLSVLDDPTSDFARRGIERLMPEDVRLPEPAMHAQLLRNTSLRARFLETYECWTSSDVADFAGSRARNTSALAGRWRDLGHIFAVDYRGTALYPAFQFDVETAKPKPVVRELLAVFRERDARPWEIALWLAAPHPRLGRPPVELLDTDAGSVVEAARSSFEHPW